MHRLDPLTLPLSGVNLIEASAGTGKTYTIASLYLRLLIESLNGDTPLSVRDILVVTYTNAATQELRERIRNRIREALRYLKQGAPQEDADELLLALLQLTDDKARLIALLDVELTCIDEAAIYTIHGFCQRMLVENAFESGALFETEFLQNQDELLDEVIRDYWRRNFYHSDENTASHIWHKWSSPAALKSEIRPHLNKPDLVILPQLENGKPDAALFYQRLNEVKEGWAKDKETVTALLMEDKHLARKQGEYKQADLVLTLSELDGYLASEPQAFELPDGFELFTQSHLDQSIKPGSQKKGESVPQHAFFAHCESLYRLIDDLILYTLIDAIAWCRTELQQRKQAMAVLSYDDLLLQLRSALHGEGGEVLAAHIRARFPYAMIDEFQDTDPQQYQIFSAIYANRSDCGFYMIGDPKQAIYSFRGADVFTYMQAKRDTPEESHFTLDTNWRSSSRLVAGLNTLFGHNAAAFIYQGEIDYHPVLPSPTADDKQLLLDGQPPVPIKVWYTEGSENQKGEMAALNKGDAQQHFATLCAAEVAGLIGQGQKGRAHIGARPLGSGDIAVLVRDRFEAQTIRSALSTMGITSAYFSRDSVFDTLEAFELYTILQAIAEPGRDDYIRAAMVSNLIAMSAEQLDAEIQNELSWEGLQLEFHDYHRLWLEDSFISMFRRLLHDKGISHRLLQTTEGERSLTNLLQLAELLQTASREHHGIENQLLWLRDQIDNPDGNMDDQRLRLESDEDLVKVVNIHTSKGLEYPVVLLPFLWSSKPLKQNGPVYFHQPSGQRQSCLHLQPDEASFELAEQERLAEDARLLYVALTRAQYLCYFACGEIKDMHRSALGWLLTAGDNEAGALGHKLDSLLQNSASNIAYAEPQPAIVIERPRIEGERLSAREAKRTVTWQWRMTSYTGLSSGAEASAGQEFGSRSEDAALETAEQERGLDIFHFPKGARAGTFMHQIFEDIEFDSVSDAELQAETAEQLQRYGFDEKWQPVITAMVRRVLNTPLDDTGMTLAQLPSAQRVAEMEFQYPIHHVRAEALNRIVAGLGEYSQAGPALNFQPASGIMRGFVDLTFEHQGRYYIVDYKSNWLGHRVEDYQHEALQGVIAHHRYDLQFLIYTLALHRYLKAHIEDYSYERHIGGVYYLFLRGMAADSDSGIYFAKPEPSLIEQMDAVMAGGAHGA